MKRLAGKFVLFVSVILVAAYWIESAYVTSLERRFLGEQLTQRGQLLGEFVALVSTDAVVGYDMISLNRFVDELALQPGLIAGAVVDQWERTMVFHLAPGHFDEPLPDDKSRFAEWLEHRAASRPGLAVQSFPITHMDQRLGRVLIVLDPGYAEPLVAAMGDRRTLLYAGAILLLSLALFLGFRRLVLRPLEELRAGSARVRDGDYQHHVPRRSDDELGQLTDAVNAMMDGLHQRTEELRMITRAVEQSSASVVITDTVGDIVYVNPQFTRVTGYTPEEVIGENPRILKSGKTTREEYEAMWRTISDGRVWRGEFHNRTKGGELFWESATIAPMRDEGGEITHYIAVKEDITQRKALEEELQDQRDKAQASSVAKGEFLAAMSHEIRTPMNVVIGMSDLLLERVTDPEQAEYLNRLQHAGNSLLELINNILDLSKIEAGRLTIEPVTVELRVLLREVVEVFSHSFEAKGVALELAVDEAVPERVRCDAGRLRQVLINLVSNALKFTDHGAVRIAVANDPGEAEALHFRVVDSGIGIGSEHLGQVFERFVQVDSGLDRRFGGTGLGLAISRQLVELMGGRIWVESEAGEGSVFHFILPQCAGGESTKVLPAEPAPSVPTGAKRILLVEDSEDNRQLIKAFLKSTDHQLELAADGREAVERFKAQPFDLVLMDMQMPVMDGYTATRLMRDWERESERPSVRIVALTAHALEGDRERSLQAGCDEHLTKPIKKRRLLEAIG